MAPFSLGAEEYTAVESSFSFLSGFQISIKASDTLVLLGLNSMAYLSGRNSTLPFTAEKHRFKPQLYTTHAVRCTPAQLVE